MGQAGFNILPGEHPIVPIMFGEAALAVKFAERMLAKGVYVIAFSYPVVPQGKARIRTQISAAHTRDDLAFAIDAVVPDRLIGDLPNFYLYASNNPSEGAIAKRRAAATLISYLTPPIAHAHWQVAITTHDRWCSQPQPSPSGSDAHCAHGGNSGVRHHEPTRHDASCSQPHRSPSGSASHRSHTG